ncbi:polysaccharide biosynthesis protein putative [Patulibacter medicamentivorans]|uniref:Polysaccharide biosynthesis protein putative n=1 Tax=Patulibacter medicamentivorans TaxID=1097667 RepID=H0E2B7_9ACTN|nr:polysaccharide biosynthesis protein putative [Patulibacter medicamentivorans]
MRWSGPTVAFSLGRLIPAAITLLATPIVARLLGPADYGDLAVALAVSAAVTAALLGWCEPLVVRELASAADGADPGARARRFRRVVGGNVASVALAGTAVSLLLGVAIGSEIVAAVGIASVAMGVSMLVTGIARAEGRPGLFLTVATLAVGGRPAAGTAAVALGFGVAGYMWGWLILTVIALGWGLPRAHVHLRDLRPRMPRIAEVRYAAPLSGVALAGLLLQVGDRLGLRLFVDSHELGRYALGYALTEIGVSLAFQVLHVRRFPLLLEDWRTRREHAYLALRRNVMLATGIALALVPATLAAGSEAMSLVGGDEFGVANAGFMSLVAAGLALNGASQWAAVDLQYQRRTSAWLAASGAGVVANFAVIFAAGPSMGIAAGGLATLVAYCVTLVLVVALARNPDVWRVTLSGMVPPVLACAIATGGVAAAQDAASPVAVALAGCLAYAACWVGIDAAVRRLRPLS